MENTTATTFTRQAASILDASGIDQLLVRWMVEDDYRKPVDPRATSSAGSRPRWLVSR